MVGLLHKGARPGYAPGGSQVEYEEQVVAEMTKEDETVPEISEREKAVLYYLVHGETIIETAQALGLSRRTVQGVIAGLNELFGTKNVTALAAHAVRLQLIA